MYVSCFDSLGKNFYLTEMEKVETPDDIEHHVNNKFGVKIKLGAFCLGLNAYMALSGLNTSMKKLQIQRLRFDLRLEDFRNQTALDMKKFSSGRLYCEKLSYYKYSNVTYNGNKIRIIYEREMWIDIKNIFREVAKPNSTIALSYLLHREGIDIFDIVGSNKLIASDVGNVILIRKEDVFANLLGFLDGLGLKCLECGKSSPHNQSNLDDGGYGCNVCE